MSGEGARILVTDDQPEALRLVDRVLGERYRCALASSLEEAREWLGKEQFELALCDIHMPGGSGWELAELIVINHPLTSVVFVTGEDNPTLAERAFEFGAHGYLVKPYRTGQLLITAMNALRRRELEITQEAQSRALEQQLQTVIDRAPLPIYVKDRNFRFIAINRTAAEPTGREPGELIGLTADALFSPGATDLSPNGDREVLEGGGTYEAEETLEVGGEEKTLLTAKFPLLDAEGEIYAVCGISADISAKKKAERLSGELADTQRQAIAELRASRRETVERLAMAIELRDSTTGEHVNRMAAISAFLALRMGWSHERSELLRAAASMHDVGKIGIADEILQKQGPLTPDERTEMQRHTQVGYDLLAESDSELLGLAATVALTHHERYDGDGYPRGLSGEEIPLEGRIASVADVFDALLSDRPYRSAMPMRKALDIMRDGRGTQFDAQIVDNLLEETNDVLQVRG